MATRQTCEPSNMQEALEADDCQKNIPPGASRTPFKILTPAPSSSNIGLEVKPQVTGLQSALSPILKYLNISNKCLPWGSAKHGSSSLLSAPLPSFGTTGTSTAANWLYDESLPEITLLNDTCDYTMPLRDNDPAFPTSAPPTPLTARCANADLSKHQEKMSWDVRDFPEITLVDVTRDSEPSPADKNSPVDFTQDIQADCSEPSGPDTGRLNATQTEELLVSSECVRDGTVKMSLEETRDVTMDNTKSSPEPSGQTMDQIQTSSAGDVSATQPAHTGSSVNLPDHCVPSSTSDIECNTSSKRAALEQSDEAMETSGAVKVDSEKSNSADTSEVSHPSLNAAGSADGTFTPPQPANLTASIVLNSTAPVSSPQNKTLDLPHSNAATPKSKCDAADLTSSVATEASPEKDPSLPAVKEGDSSCGVQNSSAESHSLQKSSGSTLVGAAIDLQNNTVECRQSPKQNATVTLSESSSSNSLQKTLDKPPSPKVCNLTTSIKESSSDVQTSEKKNESPEGTFEVNSVTEVSSEAAKETKDHSQSGLKAMAGLSDSLNHQTLNTGNNRVSMFNLEESLDLRMDCLVTSTPITTGKLFSVLPEREEGKKPGAQQKLYVEGPSNQAAQVPPDVPSNIVSDRKTFLKQNVLPPPKAGLQSFKYKAASALPTSGLPVTRQRSQATEAFRNAALAAPSSYNLRAAAGSRPAVSGLLPPQSGIPSGIQRAALGAKLPPARGSALYGPAAANPVTRSSQAKKHPLTRVDLLPSSKRPKIDAAVPPSSAESSTCASDANKAKSVRQPASSQRAARTRRDDAAVPSSGAASSAPCDAASRARGLKQPVNTRRAATAKVEGLGCANCALLEKEIKRLNEELLKCKRQEEECKRSQS